MLFLHVSPITYDGGVHFCVCVRASGSCCLLLGVSMSVVRYGLLEHKCMVCMGRSTWKSVVTSDFKR